MKTLRIRTYVHQCKCQRLCQCFIPSLQPPPLQFYFMHILNTDLCHGFVAIKINKTVRESAEVMVLSILGNFSPMPKWSILGSSSPRKVRFRVKGFFLVKKLSYFPVNTHGHIWNYHFRWPRLRYTSNKIVGVVV